MKSKQPGRPRNLMHDHPLMKKGGVHDKTTKAKRRTDKQAMRKAWFSPSTVAVLGEGHAGRGCL